MAARLRKRLSSSGRAPMAVVFDSSALLALGSGHRLTSRLLAAAHHTTNRVIYAPAMCLAAATADRPAIAEHVGSLLAIQILDLGYSAASQTGAVIANGVDWQLAHAVTAASPTYEWPSGLPVVTAEPEVYTARGIHTIPLD